MHAQRQNHPVSQNHKALLANAYNELGKELSSTKIRVVGNYTLGKVIGEGAYGKVRLGTHRLTSTRVAIKQIPKAMSSSLTREIHHHRQLHHPNIAQMYEVIATESHIWIVTELCCGGELFDYLVEKGRLSEQEARIIFGQLCLAVNYLHEKGIVHRDLKLENVLLDERCRVKLGDFGFTREFEKGSLMETFCGTTGYASPEMLQGRKYQGPEVDVWSLGVILYTLLTGTLPFDDDDEAVMRDKIIIGEFEDPAWLSLEARDLIKKVLVKDTLKRLTIPQILGHPWFKTQTLTYESVDPEEEVGGEALNGPAAQGGQDAAPPTVVLPTPPPSSGLNQMPSPPPPMSTAVSSATTTTISTVSTSQFQSASSSVESHASSTSRSGSNSNSNSNSNSVSHSTSNTSSSIPTTPDDDDSNVADDDDDNYDSDEYDNEGAEADNSAEDGEGEDEDEDDGDGRGVYVDADEDVVKPGVRVQDLDEDDEDDDPFLSPKAKEKKTGRLRRRNTSESTVNTVTGSKKGRGAKSKASTVGAAAKGVRKEDVDEFYARTGGRRASDAGAKQSAQEREVVDEDEDEEDGGDVLSALPPPTSIGLKMKMKVSTGPSSQQQPQGQGQGSVYGSAQPIPSGLVSSTNSRSTAILPPIQTTSLSFAPSSSSSAAASTATTGTGFTTKTPITARSIVSPRSTSAPPPQPPIHPVRTPARTKRRSVSSTHLGEDDDDDLGSTDPVIGVPTSADAPPASTAPAKASSSTSASTPPQTQTKIDFYSLLTTPAPLIFSTPLERQLLNELSGLGLDTAQIVHSVLSDACDSAGAIWWMVKKKRERRVVEEVEKREKGREREGVAVGGGEGKEKEKEGEKAQRPAVGRARSHSYSQSQQQQPALPSSQSGSSTTRVRSGTVAGPAGAGAGPGASSSGAHTTTGSRHHRVKVNAGVQTDPPPPQLAFIPPTPTLSSRFSSSDHAGGGGAVPSNNPSSRDRDRNRDHNRERERERDKERERERDNRGSVGSGYAGGDKFGTPTRSSLMMLSPSSSSTLGAISAGVIAMGETGSVHGSIGGGSGAGAAAAGGVAAGSGTKSYPSTPGGSMKEKSEKEGRDSKDSKEGKEKEKEEGKSGSGGRKGRSGSVSISQRVTTALEAAGLVRKKSSEAVKGEKEKEKEREKEREGQAKGKDAVAALKDGDRKLSSSTSLTSGDEPPRSSYASLSGTSAEAGGQSSGSGSGIRNKLTKSPPGPKHPYQPQPQAPHQPYPQSPSTPPPPPNSAASATSLNSTLSAGTSTPTHNAAKSDYQKQLLNSPWILTESGEAIGRVGGGPLGNGGGSTTSVGGSTTPLGSPGRGSGFLSLLGGGGSSKNVDVIEGGDSSGGTGASGGNLQSSMSAPNLTEHAGGQAPAAMNTSNSTPGITGSAGKKKGQNQGQAQPRNRANILTAFRLWFYEDRKGKRKEQAAAAAAPKTTGGALYGYVTRNGHGTGKRRGSNSSTNGGRFGRSPAVVNNALPGPAGSGPSSTGATGHRPQRPSVSSKRSSSINSRRSSAASLQMMVLDSPQIPTRRSFGGSHTPNSERAAEYSSRPSSIRSFSMNGNGGGSSGGGGGQRHRKSPSASSGGSAHYRTASPISRYHRRAGSGSSGSRVVRQIPGVRAPVMHHSTSASSAYSRHMRSGSAASSLHSPASSRPASFYEVSESEGGGPSPSVANVTAAIFNRRTESPFRGVRRRNTTGGWEYDSTPRKGYSYAPYHTASLSRSSWKKSWGLEPPGWQNRGAAAAQLPYEVLAISVAPGNEPSSIRDVFSGGRRGSISNGNGTTTEVKWVAGSGDDSDWVDEDDDIPTFAGGLGQTGIPASVLGSVLGGSGGSGGAGAFSGNSGNALGLQSVDEHAEPTPPAPASSTGSASRGHRSGSLSSIPVSGSVVGVGTTGRRTGRASPVPMESVHENTAGKSMNMGKGATETRTGRRQLPNTRPGPAFKHAIQEEDEDEEEE